MKRAFRFNLAYVLFALLGIVLVHDLWSRGRTFETIPYSEFRQLVAEKKVKEVLVVGEQIQGELIDPGDRKPRFITTRVDPALAEELDAHGVAYRGMAETGSILSLLVWIVPIVLLMGLAVLFVRRMASGRGGGSLLTIGKSKAKVYVETQIATRFDDVAGVDEAKGELQEIVSFLKDPKSHGRLGARMPKGVLLVGPPGTGKTLLARAVAGEANVPFFSISGSEFVEMFVGVGAARVRDLFEQARSKAPCIIFVDELDALGKARNSTTGFGGHDEKEQTLNQLLVELDGFDSSSGIVLLGATNRPEILDPALLRAGRFDRQVLVDRPDRRGRAQILSVHSKRVRVDPKLDLEAVAALTPGFTGADLANLVNEAALAATRRDASNVALQDFTDAIERIVAGLEKRNRLLNPRERTIVAHHEMGHALVAGALGSTDPVHKVSIIPRGIGSLGYTITRPTDERYLMTREELEQKMSVLLGGRAAEHLVFGHFSTGAADDLAKVAEIARSMVTRYAMVPELGSVAYDTEPQGWLGPGIPSLRPRSFSEETAREIDCAVREIVDRSFDRARAVLARNRTILEESAGLLLEKETLEASDLQPFFERVERGERLVRSEGRTEARAPQAPIQRA